MGRRGYSQNAGVLVVLVIFSVTIRNAILVGGGGGGGRRHSLFAKQIMKDEIQRISKGIKLVATVFGCKGLLKTLLYVKSVFHISIPKHLILWYSPSVRKCLIPLHPYQFSELLHDFLDEPNGSPGDYQEKETFVYARQWNLTRLLTSGNRSMPFSLISLWFCSSESM